MILELLLWTEPNIGNIKKTKKELIDLGLISARLNDRFDKNVMVWEDSKEMLGRYRVHLYENENVGLSSKDIIYFHYWLNKERLTKSILKNDPMKLAINNVYKQLHGAVEVQSWGSQIISQKDLYNKYF